MSAAVIGHAAAREELERDLPPVTLLLGPRSIGKTTLAMHLGARHCRVPLAYPSLTAGMAREIVESAPLRRVGAGGTDVTVIDMDSATEAAQNILLKVLEEPPPHRRYILVASRPPLPTVMSRARAYRLGLLTDEQVALVLRECGAGEHEAEQAAARGRGQVAAALEALADKEADRVTAVVAAAVRSAAAGGGPALDMVLRNWTPEHTVVLRRWAMEAASGRWAVFTEDFGPGVSRSGALRVLEELSEHAQARTGPAVALATLRRH